MIQRIYHGDALRVLPTLPAGSVDAVITDPPYSSGGAFRGDRTQTVHAKYVSSASWTGHQLAEAARADTTGRIYHPTKNGDDQ